MNIYEKAMMEKTKRHISTFTTAANSGYIPARLELFFKEWKPPLLSYGFAVQLRPFVDKGCEDLDFYFGVALKAGSAIGSESYCEGMYWMARSGKVKVLYPEEGQEFKEFCEYHTKLCSRTYHPYDGLMHVGPYEILAPSKVFWENYKAKILKHPNIRPLDAYQFPYKKEQLLELLKKYKVGFVDCSSSLSVFSSNKEIGKISVKEGKLTSFKKKEIQPLIDFIENVMVRCGSATSARSWLLQFELIFKPL